MRWSITIGRIFGITFKVHVTFLLLLLLVFVSGTAQGGTVMGLTGIIFISAVFACVLIHELGHSLIAKRFGKQAESITLLPMGGIAMIDELPEKPIQEILMSIGGPAINLAIAAVLFLMFGHQSESFLPGMYPVSFGEFVSGLISINVLLAAFNLIPAFPLDGGRVLRALLALRLDFVRATSTAVFIGEILAVLLIFYGVLANWWLILIGFFIYIAAEGEKQHVIVRSVLHQATARDAAATDFQSLAPSDTIGKALDRFYHGCQDDFPVVEDGSVLGMLTRPIILAAINKKSPDTPVSEVMDTDLMVAEPWTRLDLLHQKMNSSNKTAAVVLEDGRLSGLICADNLARYFAISSAVKKRGRGLLARA